MIRSQLSGELEDKGYSRQFFGDLETPTTDPWKPCVTHLTVTYTGDDPEGVATWKACNILPIDPSRRMPGMAVCDYFDERDIVPAVDDYSTGLQILEETSTTLKLRVLYRYPRNPSTIDGGSTFARDNPDEELTGQVASPLIAVEAYTVGGDVERKTFLAGCPAVKVVEEAGRKARGSALTCTAAVKWEVIAIENAGPHKPGESPSASGKRVVIRKTACVQETPVPFEDLTPSTECCTFAPSSEADWYARLYGPDFAWEAHLAAIDASPPKAGAPDTSWRMLPPREGAPWDGSKRPSRLTRRWPVMDWFKKRPSYALSKADAEYGGEVYGYAEIYHAYLGTVSAKLVYEEAGATMFGGFGGADPATPLECYDNGLAQLDNSPLAEVDVSIDMELTTSEDAHGKARPGGTYAKVTVTGCCDCCGVCSEENNPPITVLYKYDGAGPTISCNVTFPTTTIFGSTFGGDEAQREHKTWRWVLDEDAMVAAYGANWRDRIMMMYGFGRNIAGLFTGFDGLGYSGTAYSRYPILGAVPYIGGSCDVGSEGHPYDAVDECLACSVNLDTDTYTTINHGNGSPDWDQLWKDTDNPYECPEWYNTADVVGVREWVGGVPSASEACICGTTGIGAASPTAPCDEFPEETWIEFHPPCGGEGEPYILRMIGTQPTEPPGTVYTLSGGYIDTGKSGGVDLEPVEYTPDEPAEGTHVGFAAIGFCYYENYGLRGYYPA